MAILVYKLGHIYHELPKFSVKANSESTHDWSLNPTAALYCLNL